MVVLFSRPVPTPAGDLAHLIQHTADLIGGLSLESKNGTVRIVIIDNNGQRVYSEEAETVFLDLIEDTVCPITVITIPNQDDDISSPVRFQLDFWDEEIPLSKVKSFDGLYQQAELHMELRPLLNALATVLGRELPPEFRADFLQR